MGTNGKRQVRSDSVLTTPHWTGMKKTAETKLVESVHCLSTQPFAVLSNILTSPPLFLSLPSSAMTSGVRYSTGNA